VFALATCRNPPSQIELGDKVDLEPPELPITSHTSGDYVKEVILLQGTWADDLSIDSVRIFDDGTTFSEAQLQGKTWGFSLYTLGYVDNEKEFIVHAIDTSGKTIEKRLVLFIDNHPPLVLMKVPQGYKPPNEFNGDISLKGEALEAGAAPDLRHVAAADDPPADGGREVPLAHGSIIARRTPAVHHGQPARKPSPPGSSITRQPATGQAFPAACFAHSFGNTARFVSMLYVADAVAFIRTQADKKGGHDGREGTGENRSGVALIEATWEAM